VGYCHTCGSTSSYCASSPMGNCPNFSHAAHPPNNSSDQNKSEFGTSVSPDSRQESWPDLFSKALHDKTAYDRGSAFAKLCHDEPVACIVGACFAGALLTVAILVNNAENAKKSKAESYYNTTGQLILYDPKERILGVLEQNSCVLAKSPPVYGKTFHNITVNTPQGPIEGYVGGRFLEKAESNVTDKMCVTNIRKVIAPPDATGAEAKLPQAETYMLVRDSLIRRFPGANPITGHFAKAGSCVTITFTVDHPDDMFRVKIFENGGHESLYIERKNMEPSGPFDPEKGCNGNIVESNPQPKKDVPKNSGDLFIVTGTATGFYAWNPKTNKAGAEIDKIVPGSCVKMAPDAKKDKGMVLVGTKKHPGHTNIINGFVLASSLRPALSSFSVGECSSRFVENGGWLSNNPK
jgi:hypothetical protein